MPSALRVLIGSPLGQVVSRPLQSALVDATVRVAGNADEFTRAISGHVRFDVVVADILWNEPDTEWTFDGLDVLESLRAADRLAPVVLAGQGHTSEIDHLDEARRRPEVFGVIAKADGFDTLLSAVRTVAVGRRLPDRPGSDHPLCAMFIGQRGHTAGRLAGAIASGRAADNASLAVAAKVSPHTANKLASHYLGPIIERRGEHQPGLPMTQASIYRWCGLHAPYLVSWCRRNGHSDVLGRGSA